MLRCGCIEETHSLASAMHARTHARIYTRTRARAQVRDAEALMQSQSRMRTEGAQQRLHQQKQQKKQQQQQQPPCKVESAAEPTDATGSVGSRSKSGRNKKKKGKKKGKAGAGGGGGNGNSSGNGAASAGVGEGAGISGRIADIKDAKVRTVYKDYGSSIRLFRHVCTTLMFPWHRMLLQI